jgi:NDP-sugar pyrophosphorylase family protein
MEPKPLGTAGAIKNAEPLVLSNPFMGFNGDSFCPANLKNLLDFHITNKLITSIVLTSKQEKGDYGSVQLNAKDEISNFYEKDQFKSSNHTNAGIYVFNDEIFQHIPSDKNSSLEYDIFPNLIKKGVSGFSTHQPFFDIGTPERLNFAKANLLKSINIQR